MDEVSVNFPHLPDEIVSSKYHEIPYHLVLTNLMNAFTEVLKEHPTKPVVALTLLCEGFLVTYTEPIPIPKGMKASKGIKEHNRRAALYKKELKKLDEEYDAGKMYKELQQKKEFKLFLYHLEKWTALMRLLGRTQFVAKPYKKLLRSRDDTKSVKKEKGRRKIKK